MELQARQHASQGVRSLWVIAIRMGCAELR